MILHDAQNDEKVPVCKELVQQFQEIKKALDKCCDLALQQPLYNKQLALVTDASVAAAGYAELIGDDPIQKFTSLSKSYASVAYGSTTFTTAQKNVDIRKGVFLRNTLHSKNLDLFSVERLNRLSSSLTTKL